MSESTTIARPYAQAIFEHALASKQLTAWSEILTILAQAVLTPEATQFIANPASTKQQHTELLTAACSKEAKKDASVENFIALLAANKRLMVLPEIKALYEAHRAEQEKTLTVDVASFSTLSAEQQQQMIASLSKRLQRNVSLNISIDPSLIGGAVIRAGDLVIDGSVRGKLTKLATNLAA